MLVKSPELVSLLGQVGFLDVRTLARFDCFRGTSKQKVAVKFGVRGANVLAFRKT